MKKQQEQKQIINLDEFDNSISLYQVIPSGKGDGKEHLKRIVDAHFNSPIETKNVPLSIVIHGNQGLATHGHALLRALGYEYTEHVPGVFLKLPISAFSEYFTPVVPADSYVITNIDLLCPSVLRLFHAMITTGQYSVRRHHQEEREVVVINKPLVMTTNELGKVPDFIQKKVGHVVKIEDYTQQQLELIVLQRIAYCHLQYEEEVLGLIVNKGQQDLHKMVRLLKNAFTAMQADNRAVLTVRDVEQAVSCS